MILQINRYVVGGQNKQSKGSKLDKFVPGIHNVNFTNLNYVIGGQSACVLF